MYSSSFQYFKFIFFKLFYTNLYLYFNFCYFFTFFLYLYAIFNTELIIDLTLNQNLIALGNVIYSTT